MSVPFISNAEISGERGESARLTCYTCILDALSNTCVSPVSAILLNDISNFFPSTLKLKLAVVAMSSLFEIFEYLNFYKFEFL